MENKYKIEDRNDNNNFINVLEKDYKLKRSLLIEYDINNEMLLEDPKFRILLLTKNWFKVSKNDLYSKVIYNPYLKENDFEKIKNIKNHHEKNIDTIFYASYILYFFSLKKSFSNKKIKGFKKKGFYFLSFPIIILSYYSFVKSWYLNEKINRFVSNNKELIKYKNLDIDIDLINKELARYKIRF